MRERFAQVYWVGGSPCSGKSTVASRISERLGYRIYDCDEAWFRHARRASPSTMPILHRLAHAVAEEIWLQRPVEQQVRDTIASYRELFPLIVSDILAMPDDVPILAVGAALMPELVAELGISSSQSLWMIPTEAFQRHHYGTREWRHEALRDTSDPARAWENWMQRDVAFASEVARQAEDVAGHLIVVDGSRDPAAIGREAQDHFGLDRGSGSENIPAGAG